MTEMKVKFIYKYNHTIRRYYMVTIPGEWKISQYENDMNTVVNCVSCGKEIRFGDGYISRRYHDAMGFGFCECADCYDRYFRESDNE